jgi:hypothetical protein
MKLKKITKYTRLGLTAVALAASGILVQAADDIIVGPSGSQTGTAGAAPDFLWQNMWGGAFVGISFDTANPPPSGDTAGSIYIQANYPGSDADNFCIGESSTWWGGTTFDGSQYAAIEMDLKYDTTSTITPASNAHLEIGFDAGYSMRTVTNMSFDKASAPVADGNWHHLSIPISASMAGIGAVHSVGFYQWNPGPTAGTMNFWVANVKVVARVVPVAPPTTYLAKAKPGLRQFADAAPNWDRSDVRTDTSGAALVSWVGKAKPVVYSFTIADFSAKAGFNCNLNLSPGDPATQTYADPDWSMPHALLLSISASGSGSQNVSFGYKTNQPIGNSMFNAAGLLTNFTYNGSAVGTWSLTFTSDTDATITAPDKSTYSATIPAANAALFADPACFYLFSGPAVAANYGESVTFSSLSLTGVGTPIQQDFTTGILNPLLVLQSQGYNNPWNTNPPNQFLLTTGNASYWHYWDLPDSGFAPILRTNLTAGVWQDETYSSLFVNGSQRWALVPPASLPSGPNAFFALVKRTFTQLQVLLPGQTNAPGTALGYVGTPTPISLATQGLNPTTVTVNACDATWHIINSVSDQIHLATSDGSAYLPPDMAMVNGTVSFADANGVLFQTQGSQTVTATDLTSITVTTPADSAPVTIDP